MGKDMKVRYDADADILYISIKDEEVEDMDELGRTFLSNTTKRGR